MYGFCGFFVHKLLSMEQFVYLPPLFRTQIVPKELLRVRNRTQIRVLSGFMYLFTEYVSHSRFHSITYIQFCKYFLSILAYFFHHFFLDSFRAFSSFFPALLSLLRQQALSRLPLFIHSKKLLKSSRLQQFSPSSLIYVIHGACSACSYRSSGTPVHFTAPRPRVSVCASGIYGTVRTRPPIRGYRL